VSVLLRRFAIVLGVSVLFSLAFAPLGSTERAAKHRHKRAEQRAAGQRGDGPKKAPREPPSAVGRIAGPLIKETVFMGVPAGLVVLFAFGVRRLRSRSSD
jgi:multidrug efflux pump subunit AcrB